MSVYYEFDIEMFDLEYGDIQDHDFFGMFQGGKQTDKSYQPYIKDFKKAFKLGQDFAKELERG